MQTKIGFGALTSSLLLVVMGCGPAATRPAPVSPSPQAAGVAAPSPASVATPSVAAPPAGPTAPVDPWALPAAPREDDPVPAEPGPLPLDAWRRATALKGLAAAPAACAAFTKRAAAALAPKDSKDLAAALAEPNAAKRDAMLVALQSKDADRDVARALRADLAPVECADAIVDPYLAARTGAVSGRVGHALVGLSLAAKLARTAAEPPQMGGARDKAKVLEFIKGPLKTWVVEQATAIEALSAGAAGLQGYGRGVAAIEAGTADLRLVDKIRSSPTPAGWDAELKQVYEASLDEALEPRKARGRDAALVGLADLVRLGLLHDARIDRARGMLAKLYGGRRIDALDRLLLPRWEAPAGETPAARATAAAPIFWTDRASWAPSGAAGLAPALARGVPEVMRADFRAGKGPAALAGAYARARLDLGRLAWRRIDFVEAAHAAKAGDDRLVLALALALAQGPGSAAEMMKGSIVVEHTEALDALASAGGPEAGMAAFDAAHLRSLGTPETDAAAWLSDVAARFKKAEGLLADPAHKKLATERAAEAAAAAAAATTAAPAAAAAKGK